MKKVEFNANRASWDSWQRPFINVADFFVHFDTGEVCITATDLQDYRRKHYSEVGITLCNSGEIGDHLDLSTISTPDGEKVAKAHIVFDAMGATNQQLVAIDHDKQEIYNVRQLRTGGYQSEGCIHIPNLPDAIAKRASLYWATPEDRPACQPIRRVHPRKLTPEQKVRGQEAKLLCASVVALKGLSDRYPSATTQLYDAVSHKVYDTDESLVDIVSAMADNDVLYAHKHGGVPSKETSYSPYLKF